MTNQEIIQKLEDARIASFVNFRSWLMSNGEKLMIAMNEGDKHWLESIGYWVSFIFECGEQVDL